MNTDTAPLNKANRLGESALSGFDLTNPDWVHVNAVIKSFAVKAKDDSLTVNPSVLFIKTCKVLKDQANVARLPEVFAEQLRAACSEMAHTALRDLQSEGYILAKISKTRTAPNMRELRVDTKRTATLINSTHSLKSQLYMLSLDINAIEKKLSVAIADGKDTDKLQSRLNGYRRLEQLLKMDLQNEQDKAKITD
jgi:hypothetical protein